MRSVSGTIGRESLSLKNQRISSWLLSSAVTLAVEGGLHWWPRPLNCWSLSVGVWRSISLRYYFIFPTVVTCTDLLLGPFVIPPRWPMYFPQTSINYLQVTWFGRTVKCTSRVDYRPANFYNRLITGSIGKYLGVTWPVIWMQSCAKIHLPTFQERKLTLFPLGTLQATITPFLKRWTRCTCFLGPQVADPIPAKKSH